MSPLATSQQSVQSGMPLWRALSDRPVECAPLQGQVTCHAAVIGSGITGSLVSQLLIEAGVDTVLVDQGIVGAGSTASSTGLLQYEVDTPLVDLIPLVGEQGAVRAWQRGREAIGRLEFLCSQLNEGCGFVHNSSLYFASCPSHVPELFQEFQCRQHFGFPVKWLDEQSLKQEYGIYAGGAILSTGDAAVNPLQLTQSLVRKSLSEGLRAYGQSRVSQIEGEGDGWVLRTSLGQICCRHVVFATGYFPQAILPSHLATLKTTYAVASQPENTPQYPRNLLIWETARPYLYLRQTPDGRIIIGGEDTEFADDHQDQQLLLDKSAALVLRFHELFPDAELTPAFVWGGTFAETADGLPLIGEVPGHQNCWMALGYGGNGITFSVIAAELLTNLILGRPTADVDLFRPTR